MNLIKPKITESNGVKNCESNRVGKGESNQVESSRIKSKMTASVELTMLTMAIVSYT